MTFLVSRSGTFLDGTLQTAAQPNITSIGTLSSLAVTGNVAALAALEIVSNVERAVYVRSTE